MPEFSECSEGSINNRTLQLTPQGKHLAQNGKVSGSRSDVDLESVINVGYTVDSCDCGLDVELSWQRGEV